MATAIIAIGSSLAAGAAGSAVAAAGFGLISQVVVGALVGGVVSAVGSMITGGDPMKGFLTGAITGGIAGGLAGWATTPEAGAAASGGQTSVAGAGTADMITVPGEEAFIRPLAGANDAIVGGMDAGAAPGGQSVVGSPPPKDMGVLSGSGSDVASQIGSPLAGVKTQVGAAPLAGAETSTGAAGLLKSGVKNIGGLVDTGIKKVGGMLSGMSDFQKASMLQMGGSALSGFAEGKSKEEIAEKQAEEERLKRARINNFTDIDILKFSIPKLRATARR